MFIIKLYIDLLLNLLRTLLVHLALVKLLFEDANCDLRDPLIWLLSLQHCFGLVNPLLLLLPLSLRFIEFLLNDLNLL